MTEEIRTTSVDAEIPTIRFPTPSLTGGISFQAYSPNPNLPNDVESYKFTIQVLDNDGKVIEREKYDKSIMTALEKTTIDNMLARIRGKSQSRIPSK